MVNANGSELRSLTGPFEPVGPSKVLEKLRRNQPVTWDFSPSLSNDGSTVAFTTLTFPSLTYEIATQDLNGSERRNITENDWDDVSPAWSTDGSLIAFVSKREGSIGIYTISSDGSDERSVAPGIHAQINAPVWSPDGSRLAFVGEEIDVATIQWVDTYHSNNPVNRTAENADIYREAVYIANVDGSSATKLTWADATQAAPRTRIGSWNLQFPEEQITHFRWSPDGSNVAFAARYYGDPEGLYVANLDTSQVLQILDISTILEDEEYYRPPESDWSWAASIQGLVWSPDSSRIIFEVAGRRLDGDTLKGRSGLYSLVSDGSEPPSLLDKADGDYYLNIAESYLEWPAILTSRQPTSSRYSHHPLLDYLQNADYLSGPGPARIIRYTDSMNENVPQRLKGWLLATIPWGGTDEQALVRTLNNRLVAARPHQADTRTEVEHCAENRVVPDAELNPGLVRDCRLLLEIRDTLAGDGLLYWTSDSPIQEWPGVTVGGAPLRVQGLSSVPGVSLTGTIPPELSELSELRVLNLEDNELHGDIPAELGKLAKLEVLDLGDWWSDYNDLTGSIPSELGNLSNLRVLDLQGNSLDGVIPPELSKLSKLEELYLDDNPLQGNIPSQLGNLNNLRILELGGNRSLLTGTIPPELGNLINLRELTINWTKLSGTIPPELGNLVNLRKLYLPGGFGGQLSGPIPRELAELDNLSHLHLGNNKLVGHIPLELGDLPGLWYVNLSGNQFTGCVPTNLDDVWELHVDLPFCE